MRPESPKLRISFGGSPTPVVRVLLWVNGLVFLFLLMVGARELLLMSGGGEVISVPYAQLIRSLFGMIPRAVTQDWTLWQPLTYMFVHERFWHIFWNMLLLWWFGSDLERTWGSKIFFRYYLFCGIGAGLSCMAWQWNSTVPTIGASGGIFGILLAYAMLFPNRVIYLYMVIPIKAKYLVGATAVITLVTLISGTQDGVSHVAHLGGMVFGLLWFGYYRTGWSFRSMFREWQRRRARRRLRLIRKSGDKDENDSPTYNKRTLH